MFQTRHINFQRNIPSVENLSLDFPPIVGGYSITTDTDAGLYEKYHESAKFDIPFISRNFIQPTKNIVISGILQKLDFSFYFDDPYPTSQSFYDIPTNKATTAYLDSDKVEPITSASVERKAVNIPAPGYYVF